jgi:sodium/potassium-transporting ATPase subunit alpha
VLSVDLITEQGPAISLAYEPAEEGVLTRPPRNLKKDRLVTAAAVRYAYGVAGVSSSVVCLGTYFLVFAYHGITPTMLAWSTDRGQFQSPPFSVRASDGATLGPTGRVVSDLVSSSGRVYGAEQQYGFHREAMAAWFLCVVLTQFWNLWNVRTRAASAFTHGVRSNKVAIYGTAFAILYMVGVIYIPAFHVHDAFQTAFLHGYFWLPQLASCLFLFAYNETVKYFIRNAPRGFVAKNFGW